MKRIFYLVLFFLSQFAFSQNLVPNASFEDTLNCIQDFGSPNVAYPWFNPTSGTPDYYYGNGLTCGSSAINNPSGYQLPRTGNAYVGIFTYVLGNTREYVAVRLDSILSNGSSYYTEFFVTRANNFRLATDKIGCVFVNDTVGFYLNSSGNLSFMPAIQSTPGIPITDTLNWVKVSGVYNALGGEQYLIIGNFYDNTNTHVDTIGTAGYNSAYYYLDDIYVSTDSLTGITENENDFSFNVFPNPSQGIFTINLSNHFETDVVIYNVLGQTVLQKTNSSESNLTIDISDQPKGLYLIKVIQDGNIRIKKLMYL